MSPTRRLAVHFAAACLITSVISLPLRAAEEAASPPPPPKLELETCRLPGLDEDARCGIYEVFEDRAAGAGRKIPLRVVVLPATGEAKSLDPLFYFVGGPGGSAVEAAPGLAYAFDEIRRDRDLVLVDVRGTGKSNPLECPYQNEEKGRMMALETFLPIDRLDECRRILSEKAVLGLYNTDNIVDDLDEVRAALGYEKINIAGGSYGTRVVQVYLRRHPEVVRTAVMEGVVPMDLRMPSTFARDSQRALDGLVAECAADPACHAAFPHPAKDLEAVLARVREAPVSAEIFDEQAKEKRSIQVSERVVIQTVRYMLYNALAALEIPATLHAAASGDWGPLAQSAWVRAGGLMGGMPDGLYLSVTCSEDLATLDAESARTLSKGTFLGNFRVDQQIAACEHWTKAPIPASFYEPVRSDVPTLIISGERDPVTPPEGGEQVARGLPNSRHLVVPDGGHGWFGLRGAECADALTAELIRTGSVEGLDIAACAASIERPDFVLSYASDAEVELAEGALERCVGTYTTKGFTGEVRIVEGRLRMLSAEEDNVLIPVASPDPMILRFAVEGAPPGVYFDFKLGQDGPATAVGFVRSGVETVELARK